MSERIVLPFGLVGDEKLKLHTEVVDKVSMMVPRNIPGLASEPSQLRANQLWRLCRGWQIHALYLCVNTEWMELIAPQRLARFSSV